MTSDSRTPVAAPAGNSSTTRGPVGAGTSAGEISSVSTLVMTPPGCLTTIRFVNGRVGVPCRGKVALLASRGCARLSQVRPDRNRGAAMGYLSSSKSRAEAWQRARTLLLGPLLAVGTILVDRAGRLLRHQDPEPALAAGDDRRVLGLLGRSEERPSDPLHRLHLLRALLLGSAIGRFTTTRTTSCASSATR